LLAGWLIVCPTIGFSASKPDNSDSILVKHIKTGHIYSVDLAANEDPSRIKKWLASEPNLEYLGQNNEYRMAVTPDDPSYDDQWYLEQIDSPQAWDSSIGSSEVVVAVLDTGIDLDHPDLEDNIWINSDEIPNNGEDDDGNGFIDDYNGWDFVADEADPNPKFDDGWTTSGIHHGTAIAGIIGAVGNNSIGITGVNWQVKIMTVRVLDGAGVGDTNAIYQGIDYAIANGADFINLSFVGNNEDSMLQNALNQANTAGVLIFAAAGNDGINLNNTPRYPVCSDHVIGIGGTDQNDQRFIRYSGSQISGGSNYGSDCIDISAPATQFISTALYDTDNNLNNYYLNGWSGTSLATPLVTGAAALLKAYDNTLTGTQLSLILIQNSDLLSDLPDITLGQMGSGRLNVANALATLLPSANLIITGAGSGGGPHVRVFNENGQRQSQFFAYAESFRGGVNVATGDVDGDGEDEIVTGTGDGGGPHVRIFNTEGNLQSQFFAYAESFRGGVNVAAGDLDGDGTDEIIAGAGYTGGPHVRVFDANGNLKSQFFAYAESFRGGVNVAAGDLDGDGTDEIIAGAGYTGGPHVRVFNQAGVRQSQFFAYAESFRGGVNVASIK
ncbi:S8 family serine peptidase, partial [Patescibacteria group bacterium]|nr:S8 family serine peptidase [Patescibacteria group bacterium]